MLDKQDLQSLKEMVDTSVTASEERMKSYMDNSVTASEERMKSYMDNSVTASEERMKSYMNDSISTAITASEERMKSYMNDSISTAITASEKRTQAKLDAMENRMYAYFEGKIQPQLQLLADGHQNILDTLAPKNRVEALEDEVVFLKSVLKTLAQDVAELKKAQ